MKLSLKQWLQYCIPLTILLGILLSNFFTQIALFEKWWDLNEIITVVDPAKGKKTEHVQWKPEEEGLNSSMFQDSIGFGVAKKNQVAQWIRQGKYEKAQNFLIEKIKLHPSAKNYSQLGIIELNLGDTLKAKESLFKAIAIDSTRASSWLNLGLYYSRLNEQNKAIQQFTRALQLQPSHNEAQFNRGLTYYRQGLMLEALTDFKAIIARDGSRNWVKARYNVGLILMKQSQWDEAAENFKEVLRLNPIHLPSRYNLGLLYMRSADPNQAIDQFKKVLRIDGNHQKSLYNLAHLEFESEKYKSALRHISALTKIDPKNEEAIVLKARILSAQKNYEQGLAVLQTALKMDSLNLDWMLEKALILNQAGNSLEAMQIFDKIIASDSSFAPAYFRKALIYEEQKEFNLALPLLQESVNLRPRHTESLLALARVYQKSDQWKESLHQLNKILKRDSVNIAALDLRFQCHLQLGEFSRAEADLQILESLHPQAINLETQRKELNARQQDREITEE